MLLKKTIARINSRAANSVLLIWIVFIFVFSPSPPQRATRVPAKGIDFARKLESESFVIPRTPVELR
jgi:hypothetical protein